jgi:anti-sigma B factor antagonist
MEEQRLEASGLETRLRRNRDVRVVDVRGQIDIATTPVFKEALGAATADGGDPGAAGHVIVNMAEVTYMDSSGFGTLLGATKRLRPRGGAIHLVGCNDVIQRMLHITRLNTILNLHTSEDDALRAIRDGGNNNHSGGGGSDGAAPAASARADGFSVSRAG